MNSTGVCHRSGGIIKIKNCHRGLEQANRNHQTSGMRTKLTLSDTDVNNRTTLIVSEKRESFDNVKPVINKPVRSVSV